MFILVCTVIDTASTQVVAVVVKVRAFTGVLARSVRAWNKSFAVLVGVRGQTSAVVDCTGTVCSKINVAVIIIIRAAFSPMVAEMEFCEENIQSLLL